MLSIVNRNKGAQSTKLNDNFFECGTKCIFLFLYAFLNFIVEKPKIEIFTSEKPKIAFFSLSAVKKAFLISPWRNQT